MNDHVIESNNNLVEFHHEYDICKNGVIILKTQFLFYIYA